jgi:uncharacterized membrane protein YcaP (DUF421 family)
MNAEIWTNMFQLGLPILEKILRPLIVYFFLVIGLRLAGKRELAQLNPFDLVVLLTLSNTVQNAIIGNDNTITGGVIGAATLLTVNYLVVRFIYSHRGIERFVEGDPDALIQNGKLLTKNLQKEMITITELQEAAHKQGFGSLEEIETATIEPDGAISFSKKEPDPDQKRQRELVNHLEQITQELNELRTLYTANQGKK